MSRRDQLGLKPAKKEKGRGRGRGGGRGAGRGAARTSKSIKDKSGEGQGEKTDQCDWNFTEEEVWEEYYRWRAEIHEEEKNTRNTKNSNKKPKISKGESNEKSKAKKRKHRASSGFYDTTDDDVEPAVKPTRSSSAKQKVGAEHANDLNEEVIQDIMSFVAQIDYAGLELDDLKVQVRSVLPKFFFSSLNIYWTRSACGVKTEWRGEYSDIANFSFGKQFPGTPSCKTIVAIGFGLHMVPQITIEIFVSVDGR